MLENIELKIIFEGEIKVQFFVLENIIFEKEFEKDLFKLGKSRSIFLEIEVFLF